MRISPQPPKPRQEGGTVCGRTTHGWSWCHCESSPLLCYPQLPLAAAALSTGHAVFSTGDQRSGGCLSQDPVDGGAAHRTLALGHVHAGLADLDVSFKVALLLALDAVAAVRLGLGGHDVLLVV